MGLRQLLATVLPLLLCAVLHAALHQRNCCVSTTLRCLQVWPHGQPGKGIQAMRETPHYHYQHGGPWWLTQALRNATGLLTTNLSEACMVWLDM